MSTLKNTPATPSVKIVSREKVFDGYHSLEIVKAVPRSLKHGGWAEEMEREIFHAGKISSVLLYIPETDEILLNQQFRLGAHMCGAKDPFLFECAAGKVDDGENVEEAAARETLEETGCTLTDLEYIGVFYTSPGCLAEEFHLFLGRIGEAESGIYGMEHEGEEIKTHLVPAAKAIRMLDEGHVQNATTAIALHWFARNHDNIRKKWLAK